MKEKLSFFWFFYMPTMSALSGKPTHTRTHTQYVGETWVRTELKKNIWNNFLELKLIRKSSLARETLLDIFKNA